MWNPRSNIMRGAVLSRAYDVVLASLLLHEQAHLRGGDELHALGIELDWLISERAGPKNSYENATHDQGREEQVRFAGLASS